MIKPKVISVIACENVMRGTSDRVTLVGVLRSVNLTGLPAKLHSFWIFLRIGFGQGRFNIGVNLISPGNKVVFELDEKPELLLDDPMQQKEVVIKIPELQVQTAGTYIVEVTANNELLCADYHIEITIT